MTRPQGLLPATSIAKFAREIVNDGQTLHRATVRARIEREVVGPKPCMPDILLGAVREAASRPGRENH